ncbi:UDP-glycosyltransferase 79B6-like [Rosa rugosa]|uniref:UDP-glycosyltransferase 79B6-like n=1 Tax=Rosa rugosa TaxID=74645 RepID=UPI002B411621|nr:UDP-glycosyltransferase 79B6-like [Rosa rugosa]
MDPSSFHIAMFPWFAMGHMTPYVHLANELASRGHRITILVPKKARDQLEHLNLHTNLIIFCPVLVPHFEGLPEGIETASEIPLSANGLLAAAVDKTRKQLEEYLEAHKPDMVFYDTAYWIPEIARKLGIKTVCYNVVCAAALALTLVPARKLPITPEDLENPPAGYPSKKVVLRGAEARSLMFITMPFGDGITFYDRTVRALRECDAISIRTCRELEGDLCDYMEAQFNKTVLLTGPVLGLGDEKDKLEERWAKWLGGFEPGSVVYCAFGSQYILEKDQFQELVLGFELTGLPFLIVLKPPMGCDSVEEALPQGFEERVKGRGVVFGGWVQQPFILRHASVGCFVNHCGFGSMWESLLTNNQIVLVPHLGDQMLNTKLLVNELKVAVEVEREANRWFSKESLSKAIRSVMDEESEVGVMVKKNHAKWTKTLSSPGYMSGYVDRFVQSLKDISK